MSDAPLIAVHFTNELSDHLEAQRLLYSKSALAKADKVVAVFLFGFGLYNLVFVGFYWWTMIWLLLAVIEWFNLLSLAPLKTKIEFKRNPKFREEYHVTFSLKEIHFKTAAIDSTLQWTHYEKVIEGPTLFLLMYGKALYTLIPKRCLSEGEMKEFRDLLQQTIQSEIKESPSPIS